MSELFKFPCGAEVEIYDIVSYNTASTLYEKAGDSTAYLGVVTDIIEGEERLAIIAFNGSHQARTSREVSLHGGAFSVENGRVYLDSTHGSHYRYILPVHPTDERVEGGVIPAGGLVHIIF